MWRNILIVLLVSVCFVAEITRAQDDGGHNEGDDEDHPVSPGPDDHDGESEEVDFHETVIWDDHRRSPIISVPEAVSAFAQDMYASLSPLTNNTLYSPLSVHAALSMLAFGATGNTSANMRETLHLFDIEDPYHEYQDLVQSLQKVNNIDLTMANGIWVNPSVTIKKDYTKFLSDYFKAKSDNFNLNDTNGPEFQINQWVAQSTNNLIPSIIQRGTINSNTALVLVNVLFFNASWQSPFDTSKTSKGDFTTQDGTNVTTDFMVKTGSSFMVKKYEQADVVRIPYKNNTYSLCIMLPNAQHALGKLQYLDHYNENKEFMEGFEMTRLNLALPKFKLTATINLNETLQEIGMANPFTDGATFSGISDAHLYINDVIQKATFEVTEYGTIASAATSVQVSVRVGGKATDFRVNRPFMFFVRDDIRQLVLFEGKFSDPRESTIVIP